jgi:hypothetical protein
MRTLMALALCAGCGGTENPGRVDSAVTNDMMNVSDAPADSPTGATCSGATFDTSAAVSALNTDGGESFLRLSNDELTAYFARTDPTDEVLYFSTRVSVTAPFTTPAKLPITNNGTNETTSPTVTADGLTLYFTSNRTGGMGSRDIWRSTRAVTTSNFGTPQVVTELNSMQNETDVYVLPDHSALYFTSNRNTISRIYRAVRQGATFGTPEEVFNDDPNAVSRVVVAPGEMTMLYSVGGDLRLSTRASTSVSWLPGVALAAIDSTDTDVPNWISSDLCRLYYSSNRTSGGANANDFNLRVAVRAPQ